MAKDFSGAVGGVLSRNNGHRASWAKAAAVQQPEQTASNPVEDSQAAAAAEPEPATVQNVDQPVDRPAPAVSPRPSVRPGAPTERSTSNSTILMPERCWSWVEEERVRRMRRGETGTYSSIYSSVIDRMLADLESGAASWDDVVAVHTGAARTRGSMSVGRESLRRAKLALAMKRTDRSVPRSALIVSNLVIAAIDRASGRSR